MRFPAHAAEPRLLTLLSALDPERRWDSSGDGRAHDHIRVRLHSLQDRVCVFCERPIDAANSTVEHIHPKQARGCETRPIDFPHYVWTNLVVACADCNNAKGDSHLCAEFAALAPLGRWLQVDPLTGQLAPIRTLDEQSAANAGRVIDVLKLNRGDLSEQRRVLRAVVADRFLSSDDNRDRVRFELADNGFYTTVDLACEAFA